MVRCFQPDASTYSKALKCKPLLEEGFLPPVGSQVFEGFAWLLGPWLESVLLIRLTVIHYMVSLRCGAYGKFAMAFLECNNLVCVFVCALCVCITSPGALAQGIALSIAIL